MAKEILERNDIPKEYTWDLESLFVSVEAWEEEFKNVSKKAEEFPKHKGEFTKSSDKLLDAIKDLETIYRNMMNVYSYTSLKLDEDTRIGDSQSLSARAMNLYVQTSSNTSSKPP